MLIMDELHLPPDADLMVGYRCEAHAHTLTHRILLGAHHSSTPRLAIRWLHTRAHQLADQLDPPDAHVVRLWLHHEPEHERALDLLRDGAPYAFTFHDEDTNYVLTVQPGPSESLP